MNVFVILVAREEVPSEDGKKFDEQNERTSAKLTSSENEAIGEVASFRFAGSLFAGYNPGYSIRMNGFVDKN